MARERTGAPLPGSWSDPSVVFSDTQRVDLFDDPRWEAGRDGARRRSAGRSPSTDDAPVRRRIRRRRKK